jgi:hypothetical protein
MPRGSSVDSWVQHHRPEKSGTLTTFEVTPPDLAKLTELATAFRAIVRPGARYPVKAYKYVCPRVAYAMDRLHTVLAHHWGKE